MENSILHFKKDLNKNLQNILELSNIQHEEANAILNQISVMKIYKKEPELALKIFLKFDGFKEKIFDFLLFNKQQEKHPSICRSESFIEFKSKNNSFNISDNGNLLGNGKSLDFISSNMTRILDVNQELAKLKPFETENIHLHSEYLEKYDYILKIASKNLDMKDSSFSVISYAIILFYTGKYQEYNGNQEIYYIFNYLFSLSKDFNRSKIIQDWALNSRNTDYNSLLGLEEFFENEIKYINDIKEIHKIIILKKSHKILYSKLDLICKYYNNKNVPISLNKDSLSACALSNSKIEA